MASPAPLSRRMPRSAGNDASVEGIDRLLERTALVPQRLGQRRKNEPVNLPLVAEAHLGFRRMDVHVYFVVRHVEEKDDRRKAVPRDERLICLCDRMGENTVADISPIHEIELHVPVRPGLIPARSVAVDLRAAHRELNRYEIGEQVRAEHDLDALAETRRRIRQNVSPALPEDESRFGKGKSIPLNDGDDPPDFRLAAPQKLPARREVEEEILDDHFRSLVSRQGGVSHKRFAAKRELPGHFLVAGAGAYRQHADGPDTRERLAPESEGAGAFDILDARDLARREALDRDGELMCRDAVAVIFDPDGGLSPVDELYRYACGARIQRIFDEFLHGARGALDHLARGYLRSNLRKQSLNGSHTSSAAKAS